MALLASISIDLSKIDKTKIIVGKNGAKYYNLQIGINDETDQYGQNVQVTLQQSQEERAAKVTRTFLGNGKVFWHNEKIFKAGEQSKQVSPTQGNSPGSFSQQDSEDDGMPF